MDDVDAERAVGWLRTWWVETVLGAAALVGLGAGAVRGDRLAGVLGLALAVAVADRLRLRLDNRSLAAAVEEVREGRVSAVRGGTPAGTTVTPSDPDDAAGPDDGGTGGEGSGTGGEGGDGIDRVGTGDASTRAGTTDPTDEA
jgi:hypothetical protein